ncbi:MAG: dihydrolipoyl dehydrogenase family protein, partial [Flavobacteriales bacterium]
MNQYDLVVIGAGPGGYVAAIRGAQLGYKTALIEKRGTLGGTCLNVGCIPSKALLDSSEHYLKASKEFDIHGIQTGELKIDFPRMIARKQEVVDQTVAGVDFLMEKNGITVLNGFGSFVDAHTLEVKKDGGETEQIKADRILIATGSEPASLPFIQLDGDRVMTSTEALELPALPERMVIIGGGVIGLELGSVYARLGTEVHVVEYQNAIIPTMDRTMGKELQRAM